MVRKLVEKDRKRVITSYSIHYTKLYDKGGGNVAPSMELAENPDILKTVSAKRKHRPALVIGFAAETNDVEEHAEAKLKRKGCDWIVANDVSPATGIMGGTENAVTIIDADGAERWDRMGKDAVARRLASYNFV